MIQQLANLLHRIPSIHFILQGSWHHAVSKFANVFTPDSVAIFDSRAHRYQWSVIRLNIKHVQNSI